jgi:hypothetical protein
MRLIFDKYPAGPSNSRLYWRVYRVEDNGRQRKIMGVSWRVLACPGVSWRAGPGLGVKNDCTRNKRWLPDGSCTITLHPGCNGGVIEGVARTPATRPGAVPLPPASPGKLPTTSQYHLT